MPPLRDGKTYWSSFIAQDEVIKPRRMDNDDSDCGKHRSRHREERKRCSSKHASSCWKRAISRRRSRSSSGSGEAHAIKVTSDRRKLEPKYEFQRPLSRSPSRARASRHSHRSRRATTPTGRSSHAHGSRHQESAFHTPSLPIRAPHHHSARCPMLDESLDDLSWEMKSYSDGSAHKARASMDQRGLGYQPYHYPSSGRRRAFSHVPASGHVPGPAHGTSYDASYDAIHRHARSSSHQSPHSRVHVAAADLRSTLAPAPRAGSCAPATSPRIRSHASRHHVAPSRTPHGRAGGRNASAPPPTGTEPTSARRDPAPPVDKRYARPRRSRSLHPASAASSCSEIDHQPPRSPHQNPHHASANDAVASAAPGGCHLTRTTPRGMEDDGYRREMEGSRARQKKPTMIVIKEGDMSITFHL